MSESYLRFDDEAMTAVWSFRRGTLLEICPFVPARGAFQGKTMKTLSHIVLISAAGMLISAPASAQVLGGVGGRVTGNVGGSLSTSPGAPIGTTLRGTTRDARDLTRETVRDTRDVLRDSRPSAGAEVQAEGSASGSTDGRSTSLDAALRTGAMVHASDGRMVGRVVDVTRDTAGRATAFTVRAANGAMRTVPAASASADGSVVIVGSVD